MAADQAHAYATADEAAVRMRVSTKTMYKMLRRGELPGAARALGQWRIPWRVLDDLAAARRAAELGQAPGDVAAAAGAGGAL